MWQSTEWHSCKWHHAKTAQEIGIHLWTCLPFLPPPAPATTFPCQRYHFSWAVSSSCSLAPVSDHACGPSPTAKKEKRRVRGEYLPRMICTRCSTTQTSWATESLWYVQVRGFLIVLNPEWTINDVFLTWAEQKFVWVFFFYPSNFPF